MGTLFSEEGLGAAGGAWCALGAPPEELQLDFCLPTGQSFRWRKTGDNQYTGVIGNRLVCLRQSADDVHFRVLARGHVDASPADDEAALRDYFNLDTQLSSLAVAWAASCSRFRDVSPHFPGARMLRQDPLECLFQFICSSNNHISRIHGMVERLCSSYGTPLEPIAAAVPPAGAGGSVPEDAPGGPAAKASKRGGKAEGMAAAAGGAELSYYAFPTLEQLSRATEEELRAAGFGYRARFIVGTTEALLAKPGGGREWLMGLRRVALEAAVEALTELPGIGPKVAACICLFSLDKHAAIPVDTHVWQIAVRHYCPELRDKSLTKKVHGEVQRVFVERFGPYAGWAHNTLFISELASQQHRLPEHLRQLQHQQQQKGKTAAATATGGGGGGRGKRRGRSEDRAKGGYEGDSDGAEQPSTEAREEGQQREAEDEGADSEDGNERSGRQRGSTQRRGPRGQAASAATADAGDAAAAAATAAPSAGAGGRGAARGRQQGRKAAAAAAAAGLVAAAVAAAAAPVEAGAAVTRSSSGSEGTATTCAAVLDGQADMGSPPAPGSGSSGRRRRAAEARATVAEPGLDRIKKRAVVEAGAAPAAAQASVDYGLEQFDDLAT